MGSDLESIDSADGVNLAMGIGKTLNGGVSNASDQAHGLRHG